MHGGTVLIGVDPHKASNTLAVMDPASRVVVASRRFANTTAGYEQLRSFADQWDQRRWAVEGCHGAGRSLAQRLVAGGESVLDVPAKLAARVRVYSQGHGRKTDLDDAVSIGSAALFGDGITAVHTDDALVSLRLLSDRRSELVALRTQAVYRLHRLLVELTPGGMSRKLKADKALQALGLLRPDSPVDLVRIQLAREHVDDIQTLDAKIQTVFQRVLERAALLGCSRGENVAAGKRLHAFCADRAFATGVRPRELAREPLNWEETTLRLVCGRADASGLIGMGRPAPLAGPESPPSADLRRTPRIRRAAQPARRCCWTP